MQADQPYDTDQPAIPDPTNHPANTNIPDPLCQPRTYKIRAAWDLTTSFLFDYTPRQIYLHLLLRLPSVYFSRVAAIFEEAALSLPEIKQMTIRENLEHKGVYHAPHYQDSTLPLRYMQLNEAWTSFVDSLLRDWNTYNIVSALILSAILTILQIDTAAQDPLIRYPLLFSQLCAVTSLLLGCLYSVRFDSSMRKTYKAAEWALETHKTKISVGNIWVFLAMPAIWFAWSAIFYVIAIMSFVWRTAPSALPPPPPVPLSTHTLLFIRILLTLVLALGLMSGWLSLRTFHRYGYAMDRAWARRIDEWDSEQRSRPRPRYDDSEMRLYGDTDAAVMPEPQFAEANPNFNANANPNLNPNANNDTPTYPSTNANTDNNIAFSQSSHSHSTSTPAFPEPLTHHLRTSPLADTQSSQPADTYANGFFFAFQGNHGSAPPPPPPPQHPHPPYSHLTWGLPQEQQNPSL